MILDFKISFSDEKDNKFNYAGGTSFRLNQQNILSQLSEEEILDAVNIIKTQLLLIIREKK